jgi:hypothetical protein
MFGMRTLDPDWIRIRIGIQPKMLNSDLDPDSNESGSDFCFNLLCLWTGGAEDCEHVR